MVDKHKLLEYRNLGHSGLQVSALSLGSWLTFGKQIEDGVAERLMAIAYEHGVNFFDNAEIYARGQSEVVMGQILQKMKWDRTSYVVSSKVFFGDGRKKPNQTGLSRKHIMEACDAALQRLQVDYLDLFFCHPARQVDPDHRDSLGDESFDRSGEDPVLGHFRVVGPGNHGGPYGGTGVPLDRPHDGTTAVQHVPSGQDGGRVQSGVQYCWTRYDHLVASRKWCVDEKVPGQVSGGNPPGYRKVWSGSRNEASMRLNWRRSGPWLRLRMTSKVELPQMAIAWCLRNPHVSTVILGASKEAQLEENLAALEVLPKLTPDVMDRIETILDNRPSSATLLGESVR